MTQPFHRKVFDLLTNVSVLGIKASIKLVVNRFLWKGLRIYISTSKLQFMTHVCVMSTSIVLELLYRHVGRVSY